MATATEPGKRTRTEQAAPPSARAAASPAAAAPSAASSSSTAAPDPQPASGPGPTPVPPSSQPDPAERAAASPGDAAAPAPETAAADHEKALQSVDPTTAFQLATSGTPTAMPFRQQLGAELGTHFDGVEAHVGTAEAKVGLALLGAEAATVGRKVAFMEQAPAIETVRHEAIHLVQAQAGGDAAPKAVSSPDHAAEKEAAAGAHQQSPTVEAAAQPGTIHRSLFGGILGGVIGAIGGAIGG
ncbi:MAG TPA: DUF4157 domain-containing protein, partial [Kofleriaceae bacterium]|nr:DUF4157 domain-containing protein [Kofleriaceae bacterium]